MLRHVLELNPDWEYIVDNLLESFQRRAVVVTYTPPFTKVKSGWPVAAVPQGELAARLAPVLVRAEFVPTADLEHVYYLEKRVP